jgi:hypothetical protein
MSYYVKFFYVLAWTEFPWFIESIIASFVMHNDRPSINLRNGQPVGRLDGTG